MKPNATLSNAVTKVAVNEFDLIGEQHHSAARQTPMRPNAHEITDERKMEEIAFHFAQIMQTLGLDLADDSLKGTPNRVAKMYVQEIFQGLNPKNEPEVKLFNNGYRYRELLLERNITVKSYCEHHFVPITGQAHVAYISSGKVIGLSKLNRIVNYYSRRPQVQERLTEQIAAHLKRVLDTKDVAVIIDADHMCVSTRGVEDCTSSTVTAHYEGRFKTDSKKTELLTLLKLR